MASRPKARTKMMIAMMSVALPKDGWRYLRTFGLFKMVTGSETVQTHSIWNTQNPRNEKNLSRLSSKRSSLPVFKILNSKKPERRAAQSMIIIDVMICLALVEPPIASVIIANQTKLEPPMKSVILSNLHVKAIVKPINWYATVMRRVIAR